MNHGPDMDKSAKPLPLIAFGTIGKDSKVPEV